MWKGKRMQWATHPSDCLSSAGSAMPKQTLKTSSTDIRLARAGGDEDDPQLFR